eukprot:TRINITY_DN10270_c0_g5_i1.p1 TRINITY_DN10270_c0_g5~~TRINITY_DN10270_c0_g5_i1.p1  ORF type:complete len:1155 (+),score=175.60 TRINITY_DN10270_c0_g5_i1:43-3507(+)
MICAFSTAMGWAHDKQRARQTVALLCALLPLVLRPVYSHEHSVDVNEPAEAEEVEVRWSVPRSRRLTANTGAASEALGDDIRVDFEAFGTQVNLTLRPSTLLMTGTAKHVLVSGDGRTVGEGPLPPACFYQGDVAGDTMGAAGLSACGATGMAGLVIAHGHSLVLEPVVGSGGRLLQADEAANGRAKHRISKLPASLKEMQADVARFVRRTKPLTSSEAGPGHRRLSGKETKYVEVVAVNDFRRYTAFGGNSGLDKMATQSLSVINTVNTIYRTTAPANNAEFPHHITVVLVGQQTIVDQDPWESTVVMSGDETDCSSLLDLFHAWGTQQQSAGALVEHDNRVLLSGRDFDGSTIGLAGVSAMCDTSRSGSVNMCGHLDSDIAGCAAVVAHELGHNFGMHHDSGGNACPQSGFIMESVGDSEASTQFSDCSVSYIETFFNDVYDGNGKCLENAPTRVFGDPVCANGFVEKGEDCDCGSSDCSSIDPCCNGQTCKFADASYECSDQAGPCCSSCKFVEAAENKVCRAAKNTCDLDEKCPGGQADCPLDVFVYPGQACTVGSYSGLCSAGRCSTMDHTCAVELHRDFDGNWDQTETCQRYNDGCGTVVCHKKDEALDYKCGQSFTTHGKQMAVPDGSPCWFPGHPFGERKGMCFLGKCTLPHTVAVVPLCGNGGIDYGEECDCGTGGAAADSCCDCGKCKLKTGNECSASEPCCDAATCKFKASGTVCRAAVGTCDEQEVCSGTSAVCPADEGKKWGTECTAADGVPSTCYGKICLASLDKQCKDKDSAKPVSSRDVHGKRRKDSQHTCAALMCCESCEQLSGTYTVGGEPEPVVDPWQCSGCTRFTSTSTFTINGVSKTITIGAPLEGTQLEADDKYCDDAEAVTAQTTCAAGQFLEASIGKCLACDSACTACTGPSQFDCTGACKHGTADARKACPISPEQVTFHNTLVPDSPLSAAPTATPTAAPTNAPPGPAPPAAEEEKVKVALTVANVDYNSLAADETLLTNFKEAIKEVVAAAIPGVAASDVEVVVSAGSVNVEAKVRPPANSNITSVEDSLATAAVGTLADDLVSAVAAVPGIDKASNGQIAVQGLTVQVTSETPSPTSAPTDGGGAVISGATDSASDWNVWRSLTLFLAIQVCAPSWIASLSASPAG